MGIPRKVSDLGDAFGRGAQAFGEMDSGGPVVLGDGTVPEAGDMTPTVRAALIRLLLLGNDPDRLLPHEKGLWINGARIPDLLDLEGCRNSAGIGVAESMPFRRRASTSVFQHRKSFSEWKPPAGVVCRLAGSARGSVLMRDGFVATGDVRLGGAKLGGNLECIGATFRTERDAKGNQGMCAVGRRLGSEGVRLSAQCQGDGRGAAAREKLGGSLECAGATFRAERDAKGNPGDALSADGLEAKGSVFLRGSGRWGRCG